MFYDPFLVHIWKLGSVFCQQMEKYILHGNETPYFCFHLRILLITAGVLPVVHADTFIMQVNDAILVGENLVSCSSDTTIKVCCFSGPCSQIFIVRSTCFIFSEFSQVWNCLSDGACTKTLRQHSDYVICLAAAEKNVYSQTYDSVRTISFLSHIFDMLFVPSYCRAIS
jgi:hypothetical protein